MRDKYECQTERSVVVMRFSHSVNTAAAAAAAAVASGAFLSFSSRKVLIIFLHVKLPVPHRCVCGPDPLLADL